MKDAGAPKLVVVSLAANIRRLLGDANECVFFGRAKKFCEFFSARLFGTPVDEIKLVGHFKTWIWRRLRPGRPGKMAERISLAQSIFKAKALIGHSTDFAVWKSLQKHRSAAESSVADDSTCGEIYQALDGLLTDVSAKLRSRFEVFLPTTPPASTGSIESKRVVLGKGGWLYRAFHGVRETDPELVPTCWHQRLDKGPPELMVETPSVDSNGQSCRSRFDHTPGSPDGGVLFEEPDLKFIDRWEADGSVTNVVETSFPRTFQRWAGFVLNEAVSDIRTGDSGHVKVTAVCESAAKVRTVTIGTAAGAYVCRVWQEDVMDVFKTMPCFPSMAGRIDGSQITSLLEGAELSGHRASLPLLIWSIRS